MTSIDECPSVVSLVDAVDAFWAAAGQEVPLAYLASGVTVAFTVAGRHVAVETRSYLTGSGCLVRGYALELVHRVKSAVKAAGLRVVDDPDEPLYEAVAGSAGLSLSAAEEQIVRMRLAGIRVSLPSTTDAIN